MSPPEPSMAPLPAENERDAKHDIESMLNSGHQSLLTAIVAQSPYGVIVSDPRGRLVLQNAAARKIWAGSAVAEDVAGWGQFRAFHKDGRPYAADDWSMAQSLRARKVIDAAETHFQRFDDTHGVLLGGASPIVGDGGELLGAVSIFADITNFKAIEAERNRAIERLRLLADVGALASAGLDITAALQRLASLCVPILADWCAIDTLNDQGQIARMAVHHSEPAKIALARDLEARYPSDPNAETGVPKVLRTGLTDFMPEIPAELIHRAARSPEHAKELESLGLRSWLSVPLQARGRVLGALTLVRSKVLFEQTDAGFAEELASRAALLIDNAMLHRATQAALQRAEDEKLEREKLIIALEKSNADLHQFAYAASHDLKAPLRAVINLAQWLEEDPANTFSDESRKHVGLIVSRVTRLQTLIDGILSYSRAGGLAVDNERVDVATLLEEVVELLSPTAPARIRVEGLMPVLVTEVAPLRQVFMNLVGNALKHSGRADTEVSIGGMKAKNGIWRFKVTDNGPGIDAKYHDRVWKIFQTLESRDKVEGAGIGLSLVRKLVEQRGGTVAIEPAPGHGASFIFTWPVASG